MRYPLVDIVRRIYREVVSSRTKVKVVSAEARQFLSRPIFIVGVFRSGTTLLRYVVDSHSQICCPPETNFIRAFADLIENPENKYGLETMGFDEAHTLGKSREWISYFYENYAHAKGKVRWADKSPSYVAYLSYINKLFPDAQYLFIYRNGLDVAHSITQGGRRIPSYVEKIMNESAHKDPRLLALQYWIKQTQTMLDFEYQHQDQCFRIIYEDLCSDPKHLLQNMFHNLNERWEDGVLEFYKYPHDLGAEDGRVSGTSGFFPRLNHYKRWPEDIQTQAFKLAYPILNELGYDRREVKPEPMLGRSSNA